MKSKEEIEQLAEHYWEGCDGCDANDKYFFVKGFGCAYRQLKEDMADKKYTDDDLKKAFYYGGKSAIDEYGTFENYINLLNKQD